MLAHTNRIRPTKRMGKIMGITYEIAKKLKEAGLNFNKFTSMHHLHPKGNGIIIYTCPLDCPFKEGNSPDNLKVGEHNQKYIDHSLNHALYYPILEELIEALEKDGFV